MYSIWIDEFVSHVFLIAWPVNCIAISEKHNGNRGEVFQVGAISSLATIAQFTYCQEGLFIGREVEVQKLGQNFHYLQVHEC